MIRGLHGLLYSSDESATRAFFRDQMKLPTNDIGHGWLIFDLPEADLGVHPADPGEDGAAGKHDVSFYCDDIRGTVKELEARGVKFQGEIHEHSYGFVTYLDVPGGIVVQLYEPKYQKQGSMKASAKSAPKKLAPPSAKKKPAPAKKTAAPSAKKKPAAPAKKKPAPPAKKKRR